MMAHIYRHGDKDGLHIDTPRVTFREVPDGPDRQAIILGTLPNITAIPFSEIDWFWIEES
jgi:hypothetical protein